MVTVVFMVFTITSTGNKKKIKQINRTSPKLCGESMLTIAQELTTTQG